MRTAVNRCFNIRTLNVVQADEFTLWFCIGALLTERFQALYILYLVQ